jgi:hypothetical protein
MTTKRTHSRNGQVHKPYIKAQSFSTVTFFDSKQDRQVILLYSLGEDGIVREFANGKWVGFPIQTDIPAPTL